MGGGSVELGCDHDGEVSGFSAEVEGEVVARHALRTGEGSALGDTDLDLPVEEVQLPAMSPTPCCHTVSAHCNHPFGKHDRRVSMFRTTPARRCYVAGDRQVGW
jgi:hypothetical protein